MIKNNKSQIGSTLTWFVAIIIVVFVMVLFVTGVTGIAKLKGLSETKQTASVFISYGEEQNINSKFIAFLNKPLSNGGTVYDLLSKAEDKDDKEEERNSLFKQEAESFLEENLPSSNYYVSISLEKQSNFNWMLIEAYGLTNGIQTFSKIKTDDQYTSKEIYILPNKKIKLEASKLQ